MNAFCVFWIYDTIIGLLFGFLGGVYIKKQQAWKINILGVP